MVGFLVCGALDENVPGLDVTVNQAPPMGGVERSPNLADQRERLSERNPALAIQKGAKIGTLNEAHRNIEKILAGASVVNRDDVRVVE